MRGKLEGSIKDKRRERLVQEHPDIMNGRLILAREAYMAYVRTVSPTEATYVPTIAGLKDIPGVRAICEREPDVEVTGADFSDVSSILANWVTDKRMRLTELVDNNDTAPGKAGRSNFNLASTIFRCKIEHEKLGRPAMFGGDEAMQHVGESCDPEFDIPLSTLASALVVPLGLDPDITTVADMDRHAARFQCDGRVDYSDCGDNRYTLHVFTWRGCVRVFSLLLSPLTRWIYSDLGNPRHRCASIWRQDRVVVLEGWSRQVLQKWNREFRRRSRGCGSPSRRSLPQPRAEGRIDLVGVWPLYEICMRTGNASGCHRPRQHCVRFRLAHLSFDTHDERLSHGKAQPDGLDIFLRPVCCPLAGVTSLHLLVLWPTQERRTIMRPFAVSDAKNPRGRSLGLVP